MPIKEQKKTADPRRGSSACETRAPSIIVERVLPLPYPPQGPPKTHNGGGGGGYKGGGGGRGGGTNGQGGTGRIQKNNKNHGRVCSGATLGLQSGLSESPRRPRSATGRPKRSEIAQKGSTWSPWTLQNGPKLSNKVPNRPINRPRKVTKGLH